MLAWVAPGGAATDLVSVAADGTFVIEKQHDPSEYVVYTSNLKPLTVLTPTRGATDEVTLNLPVCTPVSFRVRGDDIESPGFVGVWIGRQYVPIEILAFHQELRGADVRIAPKGVLRIADVCGIAPIAVAFAPEQVYVGGPFVDPFTRPEFQAVPRQVVNGPEITVEQ
jgi:hypothetical protein